MTTIEKIESRLFYSPDGCWYWTGATNGKGYGSIWLDGKLKSCHRTIWIAINGEIDNGLVVCHHCDNPICVNPNHLFLGSYKDNSHDNGEKGQALSNLKKNM